jgi:hypothetical protein
MDMTSAASSVVSQVRRAKLGFVYQVKVLILEALAMHSDRRSVWYLLDSSSLACRVDDTSKAA